MKPRKASGKKSLVESEGRGVRMAELRCSGRAAQLAIRRRERGRAPRRAAEQRGAPDGAVLAQAVRIRARQGSRRARRASRPLQGSRAGTASASPRPAGDRGRSATRQQDRSSRSGQCQRSSIETDHSRRQGHQIGCKLLNKQL
jgi:hypothetical protein